MLKPGYLVAQVSKPAVSPISKSAGRSKPNRRHNFRASAGLETCATGESAFTLLEVIVACSIFFIVAFAILQMVVTSLGAAKALQQKEPDAGMLAATLSLTNRLEEGSQSGDFEELVPGLYKGYRWAREINEVSSNGLFQVDFIVYRANARKGPSETHMSVLMFRPGSKTGSRFGPTGAGGP